MDSTENKKPVIIKSGFLHKRSKYLKLWKKRFIVLTNKNLYSFTTDDLQADCTMNLLLKKCKMSEISDEAIGKTSTLSLHCDNDGLTYYFQASNEHERNEWVRAINLEISNPGVIMEQEEIDWLQTRRLSDISQFTIKNS